MLKKILFIATILGLTACVNTKTVTTPQKPIVRIFELEIDPNKIHEFNQWGKHNISQSVNTEKGVLAMYALADKENPSKIYVVEAYRDEKAYQAHRQSVHFQSWLNATKDMIISRKMIETNPVIFGSKAISPNQ